MQDTQIAYPLHVAFCLEGAASSISQHDRRLDRPSEGGARARVWWSTGHDGMELAMEVIAEDGT